MACLFQHQLPGSTVESCLQPCRAVNPVCTVACLFQHQLPGSTVSVESCLHCSLSVSASAARQHCHTVESCLHCGLSVSASAVRQHLSHCGVLFALSVSASASWQHCGVLFAALQSCKSCLDCGLSVSASAAWHHCVCGILFALWPVCFSISFLAALWSPVCTVACLFQHQLSGSTVSVESCLHCGLSVSASAV